MRHARYKSTVSDQLFKSACQENSSKQLSKCRATKNVATIWASLRLVRNLVTTFRAFRQHRLCAQAASGIVEVLATAPNKEFDLADSGPPRGVTIGIEVDRATRLGK